MGILRTRYGNVWPRSALAAALAALLFLPGCGSRDEAVVSSREREASVRSMSTRQAAPEARRPAAAARPQIDQAEARRAFTLVNQERLNVGLPPLMRRQDLDDAARLHAFDQVKMKQLSHYGSNGSQIANRLAHIPWINAGENLARNKGYSDSAGEAVRGWLASASHRAIMLSPDFSHCGLAAVSDPETDFMYIVQVFVNPGSF